ncbi:hypothetical protein ACPCUX_05560 [Cellulosimicrobium sp. AB352]|uniref:hypothetical protein n=1 Tax=Cellulosimicrobium sp. AB352 TaxID=3413281 RepID=UPI003C25BC5D
MIAHPVKGDFPDPGPDELEARATLALSLLNWRDTRLGHTIRLAVAALLGAAIEDLVEIDQFDRGDYPDPDDLTLGA